MALVFYVLGGIVVAAGALWTGLVITTTSQVASGPAIAAAIVVAAPGLATMMSGLLLLAIGGALARLDRIVENTAAAAPRRPIDTSRWSRADRERYEAREPELR